MPRAALHSDFSQPSASRQTYSITDLCAEFGVTPRALRFYEDEGLIGPKPTRLPRRIQASRARSRQE